MEAITGSLAMLDARVVVVLDLAGDFFVRPMRVGFARILILRQLGLNVFSILVVSGLVDGDFWKQMVDVLQ